MIRLARAADHPAIRQLNLAAFDGATEAELVDKLRADGDLVFELVAETEGELAGHILFSRLWTDSEHLYVALAPMAVRPDRQRSGTGSALVRAGLDMCKEFGAHGVLVLGHPAYYRRFGFTTETVRQVKAPYSGSEAFMGLALADEAFAEPLMAAYPSAFSGS